MTVGLTRWTPTGDLVRDRFNRLFGQVWDDAFSGSLNQEASSTRNWNPAVDIEETNEGLTFTAELPGMNKDDIEVSIEGNVLTLSGNRKFEKDVQKGNYHRIERAYGVFSRSFTLPSNLKTGAVEASFDQGLLTVFLPKAEEAKPHKISIR